MHWSIPSIVLVAALFIDTLSHCSAENVYCVTPTATSCSSYPHSNHCATLSEYAQESEMYFTSNTTMVFLPGDHVLHTNIYHSHQHSKVDHAGTVFVRQDCNSCLPWISWPQLYKYGQVQHLFFTVHSLQQKFWWSST